MKPKNEKNEKPSKLPDSKKKTDVEVSPRQDRTPDGKTKKSEIEVSPRQDKRKEEIDPSKWINTSDWFSNITGVSESEFVKMKGKLIQESENHYLHIKNAENGKIISAGKFSLASFEDLYGHAILKIDKPSKKTGEKALKALLKIEKEKKKEPVKYVPVEFINRSSPKNTKDVDVGYLQSLPEYRNTVFQVASNFNVIEGVSELQPPDCPSFTEYYYKDKTQGPSASISAGAAAIVRVHAAFYATGKDPSTWQQTQENQINLLKNLEEYFPTFNGYVLYENGIHFDGFKKFPPYLSKAYYKLLLSGLIGYHKDVQIVTGCRWYPDGEPQPRREDAEEPPDTSVLEKIEDPAQVVDQVFCAAVNMKQGRTGHKNAVAPNSGIKSRMILDLAYQGTYLAALANSRDHIVLTMIGGGAFGNEKQWIFEAIVNAHTKWGMEGLGTLKKVSIIAYQPQEGGEYNVLEEGLKQMGIPVHWKYQTEK